MFKGQTIFIAPVDWGLGHASRCVPLIGELARENRVVIGTTETNRHLFDAYFPGLAKTTLPSYRIRYSRRRPQWLKIMLDLPAILIQVRRENRLLKSKIKEFAIDVVISDSRYGLYQPGIRSVFITHQLTIFTPFSGLVSRLHEKYLRRFDEIWVPDYGDKDESLAGELSHPAVRPPRCHYIGPLSAIASATVVPCEKYDYLLLLSGPEPQRSILESLLLANFSGRGHRVALVRGVSGDAGKVKGKPEFMVDFASGGVLKGLVLNSAVVVCRSGYSTLMDMHLLGKRDLLLIPTPGQPEQEYLAKWWSRKFGSRTVSQKRIAVMEI